MRGEKPRKTNGRWRILTMEQEKIETKQIAMN